MIDEALRIRKAVLPDDHALLAVTHSVLGECLTALDRHGEAESLVLESYEKLKTVQGEFVWHHHEAEDEFFLVLKGRMKIHLRDRVVSLREGECFIVPRGVEHKPAADDTCDILLFEPAATRNTGNVTNERTIEPPELKRI